MSIALIRDRLATYDCTSEIEEEQAIREITQEIVLAALGRTDFFREAAFQGGTCLRVLYGLDRFSEDLDFALKERNPDFTWEKYLGPVTEELAAYGYRIEIQDRSERDTMVRKVLIKDTTIEKSINFRYAGKTGVMRAIRIRLEVDTNPPSGSEYEIRYLDFPFVSSVVVQTLPSLLPARFMRFFAATTLRDAIGMTFCGIPPEKHPSTMRFSHPRSHKWAPGRAQVFPWIIPGVWKPFATKSKLQIGMPPQKMFGASFVPATRNRSISGAVSFSCNSLQKFRASKKNGRRTVIM